MLTPPLPCRIPGWDAEHVDVPAVLALRGLRVDVLDVQEGLALVVHQPLEQLLRAAGPVVPQSRCALDRVDPKACLDTVYNLNIR